MNSSEGQSAWSLADSDLSPSAGMQSTKFATGWKRCEPLCSTPAGGWKLLASRISYYVSHSTKFVSLF